MRLLSMAAAAATLTLAAAGSARAADSPQLSVAPDGTAHVVWGQSDQGVARAQWGARAAGGTVADAQYFTPAGESGVLSEVASMPDGRGLAVWVRQTAAGGQVALRRRATDGSLGPVQTLSEGGVQTAPRIAVDADGDATVVWARVVAGKQVVEARRRAVDGSLSSVRRLSAAAPTYSASAPEVAVDPAGNAYVAWQVLAPTPYVQARRRAADGTLSAVQNLTSGSRAADPPLVAVDAAGNALFAWRRFEGGQEVVVQVRRRSAGGTLGSTRDVSPAGATATAPDLSVAPGGGASVTWHRSTGAEVTFETRRRSSGGTFGPVETVSVLATTTTGGRVGLDADGDAVFAWRVVLGAMSAIASRRRTAAGTWSPTQETSLSGGTVGNPELGVEPGGGATIAWLRTGIASSTVEARRRSADGQLSSIDRVSD